MTGSIDFYFEFASPYGYLASLDIDDLAARHGRTVNWRPFMLGAIFKVTNSAPMMTTHSLTTTAEAEWRSSFSMGPSKPTQLGATPPMRRAPIQQLM